MSYVVLQDRADGWDPDPDSEWNRPVWMYWTGAWFTSEKGDSKQFDSREGAQAEIDRKIKQNRDAMDRMELPCTGPFKIEEM